LAPRILAKRCAGTKGEKCRAFSAIETIHHDRVGAESKPSCPLWVDAVEKVGSKSRMRNNRIEEACCSNQSCANYWFLESKLPCGTLKIFFQQYRSKAEKLGMSICCPLYPPIADIIENRHHVR
jgi:hypothetical protein